MKVESILLISLIPIGIITLLSLMMTSLDEKPKLKVISAEVYHISSRILFIVFMLILVGNSGPNFHSVRTDQEFWFEYDLPQINSTMTFTNGSNDYKIYMSSSNDSVRHFFKKINFDYFDIYSIEDEFINLKTGQILKSYFVCPNLIRDSLRILSMGARDDWKEKNYDTISKPEFDETLKKWGLYDNTKRRFDF